MREAPSSIMRVGIDLPVMASTSSTTKSISCSGRFSISLSLIVN
jgi:hypothetical protein